MKEEISSQLCRNWDENVAIDVGPAPTPIFSVHAFKGAKWALKIHLKIISCIKFTLKEKNIH